MLTLFVFVFFSYIFDGGRWLHFRFVSFGWYLLYSTGKIYNLPNPKKNGLTKKSYEMCQNIVKGLEPIYPPGFQRMTDEEFQRLRNETVDPYIKSHIKKRGGAHAILMAFHYGNLSQTVTKQTICQTVKQFNLCDEEMDANFHQGRMYGAWKSKDTLVRKGYLIEYKAGVRFTDRGFRSNGMHTYSITEDGKRAIQSLLQRWPEDAAQRQRHQTAATTTTTGNVGEEFPQQQRPTTTTTAAAAASEYPQSRQNLRKTKTTKTSKFSDDDERELRQWVLSTNAVSSVKSQKEFKVGKERRRYLHDVCEKLMEEIPGLILQHESIGEQQRTRRLFVTILAKPTTSSVSSSSASSSAGGGVAAVVVTPSSTKKRTGLVEHLGTDSEIVQLPHQPRQLFTSRFSGGGNRLGGGNSDAREVRKMTPGAAAARAAINRCRQAATTTTTAAGVVMSSSWKRPQSAVASIQSLVTKSKRKHDEIIDISDDDDDDAISVNDNMDRKLPARRRKTSRNDQEGTGDDEIDYQPGDIVFVVSDSDGYMRGPLKIIRTHTSGHVTVREEDGSLTKVKVDSINLCTKKSPPTDDIEEIDSDCEIILDDDPKPTIAATIPAANPDVIDLCSQREDVDGGIGSHVNPDNNNSLDSIEIWIDSRERSRNNAPRELRMGLTSELSSGPLNKIWPSGVPIGIVKEQSLVYGDFAFIMPCQDRADRSGHLSVVVERKVVRDLVQRSARGDHWKQLQRMRDHCQHALLLIENDTQLAGRFDAYGTTGDDRKPSEHVIENADDLFLFIGRAIHSSEKIKFIQTREQHGTFRSIGALALMAMLSTTIDQNAPSSPPTATAEQNILKNRLTDGGIDWKVAGAIAKEIGSVSALERLLDVCTSDGVKDLVLLPVLENTFRAELGDLKCWSSAAAKAFRATAEDRSIVRQKLNDLMQSFGSKFPFSRGAVVSNLYSGDPLDEAVSMAFEHSDMYIPSNRRVFVEVGKEMFVFFDSPVPNSFYTLAVKDFPYGATAKLVTKCGKLMSDPMYIYVVGGQTVLNALYSALGKQRGAIDYVEAIRQAAGTIVQPLCCTRRVNDRHVIIVRGLQPAVDAARAKDGYRDETRSLCEAIFATLMLDQNFVVLQAVRKKEDELKMILKQLSLSCYNYQYLTKETNAE